MNRLSILLTNIWLDQYAGSEVVVRDLAFGLARRGHRPIVYSPALGEVAREITARGISTIDDLRKLGESPDLIHAHHSIPCGEALIRFPQVPAIHVCHAFEPWIEAPAHFPQIGAYVAVDEACRDRLVQREGIEANRVVVLRNAVDLRRISPRRRPLGQRPGRAMAFAKSAGLAEPRIACVRLGIEYQALGSPVGRTHAHPERELVEFDLVFASARGALEALCCGCAVVVCDHRGLAGMVTTDNFATLQAQNFGLRSLRDPVTVDRCVAEIGRYDPVDAAAVAERARRECDQERLLDAFESLYAEVLSGARRPTIDASAHEAAVARFLHENLPRRPGDTRWPWRIERDHLQGKIEKLQAERANAVAERERTQDELVLAQAQLDRMKRSPSWKLRQLLRRIVPRR